MRFKIINVLLVAPYFEPTISVSVLRPAYWFKHIHEIDDDIVLDVVTGTPSMDPVPNSRITRLPVIEISPFQRFVQDSGISWRSHLIDWLKNSNRSYDVAIFTGGPFYHINSAKLLRKNGTKIIIDFRDPFAHSPGFTAQSWYKTTIRSIVQRNFLSHADLIITVNRQCADIIRLACPKRLLDKIEIIPNGFDESLIGKADEEIQKTSSLQIIYPGKFLHHRISPNTFLNVIAHSPELKHLFNLHYIGINDPVFTRYELCDNFSLSRPQTYENSIKGILKSDIGLIFTGGEAFESTTKVYDYIGCRKPILVITSGKFMEGALGEILADYPGVVWAANTESSICSALSELSLNCPKIGIDIDRYSRRRGLQILCKLISGLKNGH